jgi:hypothetical protein
MLWADEGSALKRWDFIFHSPWRINPLAPSRTQLTRHCAARVNSSLVAQPARQMCGPGQCYVYSGSCPTPFLARGSPGRLAAAWHHLCVFLPSLSRAGAEFRLSILNSWDIPPWTEGLGDSQAGEPLRSWLLWGCKVP